MPDHAVAVVQLLVESLGQIPAEAPRYRNADATAYWGLIVTHGVWAVGFSLGVVFDLADIRRGYYGTDYKLEETASFFAYASGFGLLGAGGIGVLILTEVPEQPTPSLLLLLLLLGGAVAIGALMAAYLGQAPQRLLGLTVIAGYAVAVAAGIAILSALGALGLTHLSVMEIFAWSHLCLGLVAFTVQLLIGLVATSGE